MQFTQTVSICFFSSGISFTALSANGFPTKSGIYKDFSVQRLFLQIVNEFECGRIHNQEYMDGLLKVFIIQVVRNNLLDSSQSNLKFEYVEEVIKYILKSYNTELTNEFFASIHYKYTNKKSHGYAFAYKYEHHRSSS
jgi:hypothetical protein